MKDTDSLQQRIAKVLRNKGNEQCLKQAALFEGAEAPFHSLHFRNLDLQANDVAAIAACFEGAADLQSLRSVSFSYNPIGDEGAIALAKQLPMNLSELGLVGCGMGDVGAQALLEWAKKATNLSMLCIEQNNLSSEWKNAFRELPNAMVVV